MSDTVFTLTQSDAPQQHARVISPQLTTTASPGGATSPRLSMVQQHQQMLQLQQRLLQLLPRYVQILTISPVHMRMGTTATPPPNHSDFNNEECVVAIDFCVEREIKMKYVKRKRLVEQIRLAHEKEAALLQLKSLAELQKHEEELKQKQPPETEIECTNTFSVSKMANVTPYLLACLLGHEECVAALISECKGARTDDGYTGAHFAALGGKSGILNLMRRRGEKLVGTTHAKRFTPFHVACMCGQLDVVKFLCSVFEPEKGFASQPDIDGNLPVHMAAAAGHTILLKYLVENCECDPFALNNSGETPFFVASRHGLLPIMKYLRQQQIDENPNNHNNIGVHHTNKSGETPLFVALRNAEPIETIQLLVKKFGADINKSNNKRETPFLAMCSEGHMDLIPAVKATFANIDVHRQDVLGRSPVFACAERGYTEIIEFLSSFCGMDMHNPNHGGVTPFAAACFNGHKQTAAYLKTLGADINRPDNHQVTPFAAACYGGHVEVLKFLKQCGGVDIHKPNSKGESPFLIACFCGSTETMRLLKEYGADINKGTSGGCSPLDVATYNHRREAAALLRHWYTIKQQRAAGVSSSAAAAAKSLAKAAAAAAAKDGGESTVSRDGDGDGDGKNSATASEAGSPLVISSTRPKSFIGEF